MTVTLTGKIVAIMAIVAILILGFAFRKYKKITDSILREQDRQLKRLKKVVDDDRVIIKGWMAVSEDLKKQAAEIEEFKRAKALDEKMLLPKSNGNDSIKDLEF